MIRRPPSKGRARGRLALALVSAMALAPLAPVARAQPTQRVSIRVPAHADALLDEALVRVQGELGAMGLQAEVQSSPEGDEPALPSAEPSVGGTLNLERAGAWIRIRASGPASAAAVVQELDTRRADVNAEVVAVRAVEALRAVMAGLPQRLPKPAASPLRQPSPPPPAITTSRFGSLAPAGESSLTVWSAAAAEYHLEPQRPALGAELGAFWGRSSCLAGALLSTSLVRAKLHDPTGRVLVRRSTALARFGLTLELSRPIELWLLVGAGVVRYGIEGRAASGYVGVSAQHDSPVLAAGVGSTAWFTRHVAAYLRLDTTVATDAPTIRVTAREIAVLERPMLGASLGVLVRAH